ncbi:MAG: hypothetical protein U0401_22900 [Anaerolineae bacterium]
MSTAYSVAERYDNALRRANHTHDTGHAGATQPTAAWPPGGISLCSNSSGSGYSAAGPVQRWSGSLICRWPGMCWA